MNVGATRISEQEIYRKVERCISSSHQTSFRNTRKYQLGSFARIRDIPSSRDGFKRLGLANYCIECNGFYANLVIYNGLDYGYHVVVILTTQRVVAPVVLYNPSIQRGISRSTFRSRSDCQV